MNYSFQSTKTPAEWFASSGKILNSAQYGHNGADDQYQTSGLTHRATKTDNILQYQNVHANLTKKVAHTTQLKDLLAERMASAKNSIAQTKKSQQLAQAQRDGKNNPIGVIAGDNSSERNDPAAR